jgi:DNA replication protein DnaC
VLTQHTLTQLRALKLDGMARAFDEQLALPAAASLAFEERFGMLVDREIAHRDGKRLARLLKGAKLKDSRACLEDIDYRSGRGLDKHLFASLAGGDWLRSAHNILICGATGCGKTWLACALGNNAARQGFSVLYARASRLIEELRIAHGDGSFTRRLGQLARIDLLLIDDFGQTALEASDRSDLLELIDDRVKSRSSIITSQLPIERWHEYLNDPTLADAILDRIVHRSHKIKLKGESRRKEQP